MSVAQQRVKPKMSMVVRIGVMLTIWQRVCGACIVARELPRNSTRALAEDDPHIGQASLCTAETQTIDFFYGSAGEDKRQM